MTGRRPFEELTKGLSLKRQAPIAARVSQLKAAVPLHELRPPPERSQEESRVTGANEPPSRAK